MTAEELIEDLAQLWLPPERIPLSQWAEKHFYLSREYGSRSGPLRLFGWQRGIFDAFTDERIREVVIMSGTQLVKTLFIQAALLYVIAADPGPVLLVQPKAEAAKKFAKKRLGPMLRDCRVVHGKISANKRDANNTIDYKSFPGGDVTLVGAGVPDNLARETIQYLFLDEVDKYELDVGGEGDPISLAIQRTITFGSRAKVIVTCSPTLKGTSRIEAEYAISDQRKPWVACRYCGERQVLKWENVKWNNSLPVDMRPATAHYRCSQCGARWSDVDRWAACDAAEWRASAPCHGVAGFWVSHLYSPWETLSQLVTRWFAAQETPARLQTFINTDLAEVFERRGDAPPVDGIYGRREFYEIGVIPAQGLFLTAAADVQGDRIEVEIKAWGRNRQSWSIAYLVLEGDTAQPAVWQKLANVVACEWPHENGGKLPIFGMAVDTGYKPGGGIMDLNRPYEFCARYTQPLHGPAGSVIRAYRTVFPIKGEPDFDRAIVKVSNADAAKKRHGLRIVHFGSSCLKLAVFAALRADWKPGDPHPAGWMHYPDYEYSLFEGLCAESLNEAGKWEKHGRNEPLDLAGYNLGVYELVRASAFSEEQWAELERRVAPVLPSGARPPSTMRPAQRGQVRFKMDV